jgi:hypothetical protein
MSETVGNSEGSLMDMDQLALIYDKLTQNDPQRHQYDYLEGNVLGNPTGVSSHGSIFSVEQLKTGVVFPTLGQYLENFNAKR